MAPIGPQAARVRAVSPRLAPGVKVRVRAAFPPGHVRTPYFLRGHEGVIEELAGEYPNPEELAYGRAGLPLRKLYRVAFRQADLWPAYDGAAQDTVSADIFEHWLDKAPEQGKRGFP